MALAGFLHRGEDDLVCDLAETYHVMDWKGLSARKLAALSCGLPPSSRTMRRESGQKLTLTEMLLAGICDHLATLVWFQTKDGQSGTNRPRSILSELMGTEEKAQGFATPEEFWRRREELMKGDA